MNPLARIYWIVRALGWDNVAKRVWHTTGVKLGSRRRSLPGGELPPDKLAEQFVDGYAREDALWHWHRRAERFLISPDRKTEIRSAVGQLVDDETWRAHVSEPTEQLRHGRLRFFDRFYVEAGWPVQFNRDPVHDDPWPTGRHWSTYGQFDPRQKDVKCVWEASRFSVAYALARDHVRGNPAAAGLFWQMFRSWDEQNPYGLSPQWVCGQEATFRLMAWLFAACAMLDDPVADAADYARLTELAWYTGRHIEKNINYARSQKNNHGISEAVGLWTIGVLFPEIRSSSRWIEKGRRTLIAELRRQIYSDGSYVQHSVNYHRVMLDDCLWAWRLGQTAGQPLSEIKSEISRALDWLTALVDPATGRAPLYGANDGASVLPLACCDYLDFRPTVQAAHYLIYGTRCFPPGPWDEKMVWLGGAEALDAEFEPRGRPAHFEGRQGGYYTTSGPRSWGMTRIHTIKDRPHQADMLHFDLWFDGVNVLRDGGTYKYYTDAPWQHFFESTAGHNTVEVDDSDQMVKGPRFLWLRWTRARLNALEHTSDGKVSYIEGEHYGYQRLPGRVVHRRAILRLADDYVVVDDILGEREHRFALRWRLCPADWREIEGGWTARAGGDALCIRVDAPPGAETELLCGQAEPSAEGWESLYYAQNEPVPTIVTRGHAALPVRLVTTVSTADSRLRVTAIDSPSVTSLPVRIDGLPDAEMASAIEKITNGRIVGDVTSAQ